MLKINIIKLNSMSVMKKIKCLLLIFTLILLGCKTENEKKTDAPKLESSVIEKIDSSKYLFLDYYFGMNMEQYEIISKNLVKSGKIKKTNDSSNIHIYHILFGSQLLEASIIPDFSPNLVGIGLLCNSTIDKKPLTSKQIDKELYNMFSDKYGKPNELFESDLITFFINKKILNISNKPFFEDFWRLQTRNIKIENDFLEKLNNTYYKGEKYFRWDNSNRIVNISLHYTLVHTKGNYEIEKNYWKRATNTEFKMTKDEFDYNERKFIEKAEANNVEIKIYYANAKDLKMKESKQRIQDSINTIKTRKNLNSIITNNKADI